MRFTAATVLAFAASAVGVGVDVTEGFDNINTPNEDEQVPAGKPFVVKWDNPAPYTEGLVYIQLLGGKDPNTLTVKTDKIASINNADKEYTWNVDASLGDDATYGLRFVWEKDDNVVQYSKRFHIKRADGSGSSSTTTVTSSQGAKTVALSCPSATSTTTTTATDTSTSSLTTSTAHPNATIAHNRTTHASTTMSKTTGLVANETASQTTAPATKPFSGATHAANSVAAIGGLVAALLAL